MTYEERIKNNMENKDSYGNSNAKRSLNTNGLDIDFYKAEKGKLQLDILPYKAGTDHHPGKIKKGEETYVLEYYEHRNVGSGNHNFLCMQMTYGKPCPICEEREALKKQSDYDKDTVKELYPKRRVLYNIIDTKNRDAGVTFFAVAHYSFERELLLAIQEEFDEGGEIICFPDLEDGKTVVCKGREKAMPGYSFIEFAAFSFKDREQGYPKKMIDKITPLDTLLIIPTYEEVDNEFFGKEPEPVSTKKEEVKKPEAEKENINEPGEPPFPSNDEKKKEAICPNGHPLGKYDEFPDCVACEGSQIYKTCSEI